MIRMMNDTGFEIDSASVGTVLITHGTYRGLIPRKVYGRGNGPHLSRLGSQLAS